MSALGTVPPAADGSPRVQVAWTPTGMQVSLRGALDQVVAPALRGALLAPPGPGRRRVGIDAGAVTSVSASGLAALLALTAYVRDGGGEVVFSRLSGPLRQAAEEAGVTELLPGPAALVGQLPPLPPPRG